MNTLHDAENRPHSTADRAILALATGLGVGCIPVAPGTWGSLLGLPLALALQQFPVGAQLAAAAACFLGGVAICSRAARLLGRDDPPTIVFDEIAAMPVVFLPVALTPATALIGWALFRLFDITKPWPARRLERLPAGLGIMADDLAAAVYAGSALWCIARWLLPA
ncbi:MAG: phosphatidylglycerophosphatase A family protein [Planctomycetaceae bacterium]